MAGRAGVDGIRASPEALIFYPCANYQQFVVTAMPPRYQAIVREHRMSRGGSSHEWQAKQRMHREPSRLATETVHANCPRYVAERSVSRRGPNCRLGVLRPSNPAIGFPAFTQGNPSAIINALAMLGTSFEHAPPPCRCSANSASFSLSPSSRTPRPLLRPMTALALKALGAYAGMGSPYHRDLRAAGMQPQRAQRILTRSA